MSIKKTDIQEQVKGKSKVEHPIPDGSILNSTPVSQLVHLTTESPHSAQDYIRQAEVLQTELEETRRERDALKNERNAIQLVKIVFTELLKITLTTLLKVIFRL
jgi:hypothetical protein